MTTDEERRQGIKEALYSPRCRSLALPLVLTTITMAGLPTSTTIIMLGAALAGTATTCILYTNRTRR